MEKKEVLKGKAAIIAFSALCLTRVILLCPYNHSQQMEGRADVTSTYLRDPIQEEGNYYKKGVKRNRKAGRSPLITPEALEKAPRTVPRSNLPQKTRSLKNTVMTVVYTLKPSSLAHSLQIHCTGLTGLRSHASWAWPEKRDPIDKKFAIVLQCNSKGRIAL